jgi:hypothetical protein
MAAIVRLSTAGHSARKIARLISTASRPISARTIDRWLARARTPNETITTALAALRADAVSGWAAAIRQGARFGKHAPARDLLVATGVIEKESPADRITIHVGDGTIAIGRLPSPIRALPDIASTPVPIPED